MLVLFFRIPKIFLRTKIELVQDDIRLVLSEYLSNFIIYVLDSGIYTFKDLFETLFNILQPESEASSNVIVIEFDDISMKTKFVVKDGIIAIKLNENSFFGTILGSTLGWVYEHYIENTSQKIVNLSNTNKINLKCDVIDGSVVNGLTEPTIYNFVLDKPPGYKVFFETETIHFKKMNKSVFSTISFYLDDDNNEVNFNEETMTFTIQRIKI